MSKKHIVLKAIDDCHFDLACLFMQILCVHKLTCNYKLANNRWTLHWHLVEVIIKTALENRTLCTKAQSTVSNASCSARNDHHSRSKQRLHQLEPIPWGTMGQCHKICLKHVYVMIDFKVKLHNFEKMSPGLVWLSWNKVRHCLFNKQAL